MKYLEQRVEELELEVKLLKAKNKLEETKKHDYLFSHSDQEFINREFITKFGLETSFASPFDSSDVMEHSLDTIMVKLSSITDDTAANSNYIDSSDFPQCYPPYPDIVGSYDDFDWSTAKDWASFNQTDEIPSYMEHENIVSEYFSSQERKIEKEFGKIIYKFRILNHEWEMDGYGYIVKDNNLENVKKIITTNHGKPMVVDSEFLNSKIIEYGDLILETSKALEFFKK